jgi:hypothetical protein
MPARSAEQLRQHEDGPSAPVAARQDEPRNSDMRAVETATQPVDPHAGYDEDLNPIDDEFINSRGSER